MGCPFYYQRRKGGRRREHSLENELGSAMVTDAVAPRLPRGVGQNTLIFLNCVIQVFAIRVNNRTMCEGNKLLNFY